MNQSDFLAIKKGGKHGAIGFGFAYLFKNWREICNPNTTRSDRNYNTALTNEHKWNKLD